MFAKLTRQLAPCLGLLLLAGQFSPLAAGQDAKPDAAGVPLNKVVMFTSGVGYFEHRGEVNGDAKVEMRFNVDDINDLLKSMILEDRGGGKISTVTYGSRDPINKTLKTFPIDLTSNPTMGDILNQVRGEKLQVEAQTPITGILVGVEKRKQQVDKDQTIEVEFMNLLTDEGLRSVPMQSVSRIKLLNAELDKEFNKALGVLALGHNTDKKLVTLDFLGQGKRPVRVGYIQETPVWKTSYRLVLDEKEQPFLQGWAIVENTTEDDWNNVQLTLVSGRPISYRMDLYEPLYVQRPLEQLELYASLRPQTYGQDMDGKDKAFKALAKNEARRGRSSGGGGGGMMGGGMAADGAAPAEEMESMARRELAASPAPTAAYPPANVQMSLANSAGSAEAGEVGELFQYVIGTPVTLARQKSAMLPIVNQSVKGEKLSIYNQSVQAKHPLNGMRLVNSTDLNLMQGPITVFDGASYAGDAKIEDMAPAAERLISYALDLKTEVAPETKGRPEQLISIKLIKGTMQISRKYARSTEYTVKNSDDKAKTVLIEQPLDPTWTLVAPKEPTEKTRSVYRFAVQAEPGKPAKLEVAEERLDHQELALNNLDDNTILYYISQKEITPAVKAALQEIVKRKQALAAVGQQRQQLEQQIAQINEEQGRIRQNMNQLDRNSELYKRYVQKFGSQEDTVEKLREQIQKLTGEENKQRQSLDQYLIDLNL